MPVSRDCRSITRRNCLFLYFSLPLYLSTSQFSQHAQEPCPYTGNS